MLTRAILMVMVHAGNADIAKLMDTGAANFITQSGAGDSKAPSFTSAEIHHAKVYRTSSLPEQTNFVRDD